MILMVSGCVFSCLLVVVWFVFEYWFCLGQVFDGMVFCDLFEFGLGFVVHPSCLLVCGFDFRLC